MKDLASHFDFGRNWSEYAELIDTQRIDQAIRGLERLAGRAALEGKTFLDIGCGSGLHSLAALRLGAARVVAVDLDPHSVATAKQVLSQHSAENATENTWEVREQSVFDLAPQQLGEFDVVYAWGSLHHTGAMYEAWSRAAQLVARRDINRCRVSENSFVPALENRKVDLHEVTGLDSALPACHIRSSDASGVFPVEARLSEVPGNVWQAYRGMNYDHDVHDWLGGYPYESVSPPEADRFRQSLGFVPVQAFVQERMSLGLFGSGNDEYVWQRVG